MLATFFGECFPLPHAVPFPLPVGAGESACQNVGELFKRPSHGNSGARKGPATKQNSRQQIWREFVALIATLRIWLVSPACRNGAGQVECVTAASWALPLH